MFRIMVDSTSNSSRLRSCAQLPKQKSKTPDPLVLPDELLNHAHWVVWKYVQKRGQSKVAKVPFYIDGTPRRGRLDSPEDIARLATFCDAVGAVRSSNGALAGVGFAVTHGSGVGAIDLDNCLNKQGEFTNANALRVYEEAKSNGSYCEVSPSGFGVRIIGSTVGFKGFNRGGFEAYCSGRFLTITGNCRDNPKGFGSIDSAVKLMRELAPAPKAQASAARSSSILNNLSVGGYVEPDMVDEGGRNDAVLKYVGYLRGSGVQEHLIVELALNFNKAKCDPPLGEEEVLNVAARYSNPDAPSQADLDGWPDPQPMKETLPPIPPFNLGLLPQSVGDYVQDIAERMSCPVEFPAISAMVSLASAIGSRIHCRPYPKDTWLVPGGAWGMVVGAPSQIKSPPMSEVLRPLKVMDANAANQFKLNQTNHAVAKGIHDKLVKDAIKNNTLYPGLSPPSEPKMKRFIVNDSTYEMLIKIADANPDGFLVYRDELAGWFHSLNKDNQKEARGLYLTSWSGTEGYATDRIGRGHVRADKLNISLLGSIQPSVLRNIVHGALSGGVTDDGLVQRFQFAVYPDPVRIYKKVDRYPNYAAQKCYVDLIQTLVNLDPAAVGATIIADGNAYLTFDDKAQVIFDKWRQQLENRLRDPDSDENPAMLAHLGKYRSLFPKIALVLHLADGQTGSIGQNAAIRAQAWTMVLEAHARRIYHTATNRTLLCASTLSKKIKASLLGDSFTRSNVLLKEWANLRTADEVSAALGVLEDFDWLRPVEIRNTGGRPVTRYHINPKLTQREKTTV